MDLSQEKQQSYFGLKINVSVLKDKEWTIENVTQVLGINQKEHVIGLDTQLAKEQQPHYHVHWTDSRSLEALQKAKARAMPNWGRTTKLYAAKQKPHGDKYAWYGYAIKEKEVYSSPELDRSELDKNAHTQKEFKKSQLNYAVSQDEKESKKTTLEDKVFETVKKYFNEHPSMQPEFKSVAIQIARIYYVETKEPIRKNNLQHMTYKYLISQNVWSIEDYVTVLFNC